MSMQRGRPLDALQRIMNAFRHFERKLDKLQEDVNYHGHTLSELRTMVHNLSLEAQTSTFDVKVDDSKRSSRKAVAVQYDGHHHSEEPLKIKRKVPPPTTNKIKPRKTFQTDKYVLRASNVDTISKVNSNPKAKHAFRSGKGDGPGRLNGFSRNKKAKESIIEK